MSKITASENKQNNPQSVTGTADDQRSKHGLDVNILSESKNIVIIDENTSSITYYGFALPGSSHASALWRILRAQQVTPKILEYKYADGNDLFDNVWNDRTTLTYG